MELLLHGLGSQGSQALIMRYDVGCGASAQIVSSCLGVSEQYCNIYKKTQDKLCKLLKYNLPAPRESESCDIAVC